MDRTDRVRRYLRIFSLFDELALILRYVPCLVQPFVSRKHTGWDLFYENSTCQKKQAPTSHPHLWVRQHRGGFMATCSFASHCSFYKGELSDRFGLSDTYRETYCHGDPKHCARYQLATMTSVTAVPKQLFPNGNLRAKILHTIQLRRNVEASQLMQKNLFVTTPLRQHQFY
jgi:hypothetical protein